MIQCYMLFRRYRVRVLLFGTGDYYERYKKWFEQIEVVALIDNSCEKQNTEIDGMRVISPEEGVKLSVDAIVILSFYVKEMKQQLLELGVKREKIYHFYDLHFLIGDKVIKKQIEFYNLPTSEKKIQAKEKRKILLLSQDLTFGGPAIALFHMAKIFKKNDYEVVYGSMIDGPLRQKLLGDGIPVVVDVNLQLMTMREVEWAQDFSLIVCNTINFYVFLSERNIEIPIIWWLHDSAFFYGGVNRKVLQEIDLNNLKIVSVGPVPKAAMNQMMPEMQIDDLLYGVEDAELSVVSKQEASTVSFVTIGYIEKRKGQDILVEAIRCLPVSVREKAHFLFVGQKTSLLARKMEKETLAIAEIEFIGTVDREQISNILDEADVLICSSREDPMPTVVAEAMMHRTACIVSDATGIAKYIKNEENGLIFENENVVMLRQQILWCIENKTRLRTMGEDARKVYEEQFSIKSFERNVLKIMKEVLLEEE